MTRKIVATLLATAALALAGPSTAHADVPEPEEFAVCVYVEIVRPDRGLCLVLFRD